jgi:hypothetical protein
MGKELLMRSPSVSAFDPYNVDVMLVSAVQTHAGARCHEAANLLSYYTLCAELHRRAVDHQNADEAQSSRVLLEESEVELRKFLFQVRRPQRFPVPLTAN